MVDYPNRARLKIYATAEIIELDANSELVEKLSLPGYRYKPERAILLHIEAYDWNCPQHITPRFTVEEVQAIINAQMNS